jgi:hypothetical protein
MPGPGQRRIPSCKPPICLPVHALGLGWEGGFKRIQLTETLAKLVPLAHGAGDWGLVLALVSQALTVPATKVGSAIEDTAPSLASQTGEPSTPSAELCRRLHERNQLIHPAPVAPGTSRSVDQPQPLFLNAIVDPVRDLVVAPPVDLPAVSKVSPTDDRSSRYLPLVMPKT